MVLVLALCGLLVGSGIAAAEAPFRIPDQITDRNGTIGCGNSTVTTALARLRADEGIQLWVVFTDDFSGLDGKTWANQAASKSGFGSNAILLAVATKDRAYGFKAGNGFPLSLAQQTAVAQQSIEPRLTNSDWAGAVAAAANGYRAAMGNTAATTTATLGDVSCASGSKSGGRTWIVWAVLLALLAGGYLWYRSARKSKPDQAAGAKGARAGSDGDDADSPPAQPLEPLQSVSDRSVQLLIATDNAVRTSEQQLTLAESTFGPAAMVGFRKAFENARSSLAAAFQLRQQIDDEIPEDESTRRAWMAEIIKRCTDADNALDAESERFDAMLDLKNRLPAAIAEMQAAITTQDARAADATGTLARLSSTYAPSALSTVIGNASEAANRLDFARSSIDTASGENTAADATPAVVAARAAQEAVAQAKTLLDGIDKLSDDLAQAAAQLPGRLAPVQAELETAKAVFGQGSMGGAGAGIAQRLNQVQTALAAVGGPNGARDPILATQRIREADATLDDILAATRSAQEQEQRAGATLQESLDSAQANITGAGDFISTRRGAVGSQARTRLAEAERHLSNALTLAESDAAGALAESRQAEAMAEEAARLAQNDVGRWQGPGGGGFGGGGFGGGGNFSGAILGGLLGGMLSGGGHGYGGGFGGFGGGGFGGGGSGFGGGGFGGGDGGGGDGGGGGRF